MPNETIHTEEKELVGLINRKLKPTGTVLMVSGGLNLQMSVGRYYLLDIRHNYIAREHVDLMSLADELELVTEQPL